MLKKSSTQEIYEDVSEGSTSRIRQHFDLSSYEMFKVAEKTAKKIKRK